MSTTTSTAQLLNGNLDDFMASADDAVKAVQQLLASDEPTGARRLAAEGARLFPDHPWLSKANRVLNPTRVTTRPGSGTNRDREFTWLKQHAAEYRGQWVALLGDELLASGDSIEDVLHEVRSRSLPNKPLVHRIE